MNFPPVVIVPGRGDGPRAWGRVASLARHFTSDVVAVKPEGISLAADAERVRAALGAATERPLILAHGYGALLATLAATARNTVHLVFVAGYMLDYGETIYDVVGGPPTALNRTPVETVGWRTLATTYVACTADRTFSPTVQDQLARTRATTFVELDAGADPWRTHAEALVQIVHEELVAVRGGELQPELTLVRTA